MRLPVLSVVIPTHQELTTGYLSKIAAKYPVNNDIEYLIIDSGTSQKAFEHCNRKDFKQIICETSTRARRLQVGLDHSQGQVVLFHHPRSLIDVAGLDYLLKNHTNLTWGGFTHQFDHSNPGLKFTSWYSNHVRGKHASILYLDHCIYFRRELLSKTIPDVSIFEDTEISKILKAHGPATILPHLSTTSAIRFQTNGFIKQAYLNQKLKWAYYFKRSDKKMNSNYEKGLNLNE